MAVAEVVRTLRVLVIDTACEPGPGVPGLLAGLSEFQVQAAGDVAEAYQQLDRGAFDVALIDANTWLDEGAGLARFVRERRPDLAVVLLTSGDNDRDALPSLKLGAHDFIGRRDLHAGQLAARLLGAVEESRNVRRRDTMVRWLEREARTDHLTGLFNRRTFDERLREVCRASRQAQSPVGIVLIDVTGTRTVNDVHGREVGDRMIRRAAQAISRTVRGGDFAARVGGDDFCVILEEATLEEALRVARRIAHETERLNAGEWDGDIPVSLSFGVASGRGCDADALFAAAENQLGNERRTRPVIMPERWWEETDGPSVA